MDGAGFNVFVISIRETLDNEIARLEDKIKSLPKVAQKHFKRSAAEPGLGLDYEDLSGLYTIRNTLNKVLEEGGVEE